MLLRQKARLSFKGRQSGSPSRKKRYEQAPHSLAGYTPATPLLFYLHGLDWERCNYVILSQQHWLTPRLAQHRKSGHATWTHQGIGKCSSRKEHFTVCKLNCFLLEGSSKTIGDNNNINGITQVNITWLALFKILYLHGLQ